MAGKPLHLSLLFDKIITYEMEFSPDEAISIPVNITITVILFLAALVHDVGKPICVGVKKSFRNLS